VELTPDTWIISDTHFGHDNIVKFCNRPQDHDSLMWRNWHDRIKSGDVVFHLGDIQTWKRPKAFDWQPKLAKLPGEKHYLKGNHDKVVPWGWTKIGDLLGEFIEEDVTRDGVPYTNNVRNYGFYQDFNGRRVLFSHYPDAWLLDWDINIHGHIHNNPYSPKIDQTRDYRNVSVEVMNYRPVRLAEILDT